MNESTSTITVNPQFSPDLDPDFVPAVLWNRAYRAQVSEQGGLDVGLALTRPDGTVFRFDQQLLPHEGPAAELNLRYVERIVKFMLWSRGGSRLLVAGCPALADALAAMFLPDGARAFDRDLVGVKMFSEPFEVVSVPATDLPGEKAASIPLGRNLDGCRIGFDLGGSDRKCAAVIDGKVVHSEEVEWNPYFETDPQYHVDGVRDTLKRAAAHLPRVDAIGGSSAGIYINNEVRVASLFRGLADEDFDRTIRRMFFQLQEEWGGIPFEVTNDGEVTALAGSMSLKDNGVLGISMGTSLAAGYVDTEGYITPNLNELAFAPVDYRVDAPADEWSGDLGCGVQYFSQQGVARLAAAAGIDYPEDMPLPERLVDVQQRMADGDEQAARIYSTIGTCFGYTIAHYAEFYTIKNLLILGRVTSGSGGELIIEKAREVLKTEFPALYEGVNITTPDEQLKRHGQAIAAASLPRTASH